MYIKNFQNFEEAKHLAKKSFESLPVGMRISWYILVCGGKYHVADEEAYEYFKDWQVVETYRAEAPTIAAQEGVMIKRTLWLLKKQRAFWSNPKAINSHAEDLRENKIAIDYWERKLQEGIT